MAAARKVSGRGVNKEAGSSVECVPEPLPLTAWGSGAEGGLSLRSQWGPCPELELGGCGHFPSSEH